MHSDTRREAHHEPIQKRHTKRQQKRIRAKKIRRMIFYTSLVTVLLCIIIFFTPLLSIRSINVSGNFRIESTELYQSLDIYTSQNLFLTRKGNVRKRILAFPYVESVSVKKKLFPPSLEIELQERESICVIPYNNAYAYIDGSGRILELADRRNDLCEINGLRLTSANPGETISLDDNSGLKTVLQALSAFKKSGLMSGITKIDFSDLENITFNYENRIDGVCGPYVDFSRKLSLFREAITSNKLTEHSRGTINLSRTGRAVYTP